MINGINAAERPIDFGTGARTYSNARIVVSGNGGVISGSVSGHERQAGPIPILFFPVDPDSQNRWQRIIRTDMNGQFSIVGVPPGEYWVAASSAHDVERFPVLADLQQSLVSMAKLVSIEEGKRVQVTLRLH
jgi:hypothetical protein